MVRPPDKPTCLTLTTELAPLKQTYVSKTQHKPTCLTLTTKLAP